MIRAQLAPQSQRLAIVTSFALLLMFLNLFVAIKPKGGSAPAIGSVDDLVSHDHWSPFASEMVSESLEEP